MKKLLCMFLAVFLSACLSACGGSHSQPDAQDVETKNLEQASQNIENDVSSSSEAVSDVKEFPFELDKTVSSLNESLSSKGLFLEEPVISPGESAEMGDHTAYTYSLGPGASLVLYVADSTWNILNFTVLTVASEIDENTLNNVGYIIGCLEGGIAGDEAYRVDEELGLDNITDDTFATSSTDLAEFLYMVQDGSLIFMITPI